MDLKEILKTDENGKLILSQEEILEYAKTIDKSWDLKYISTFLSDEYKLKLLELNKIDVNNLYSYRIVDSITDFEILKKALKYTTDNVANIIKKFDEDKQIELIPYTNVNILSELARNSDNDAFKIKLLNFASDEWTNDSIISSMNNEDNKAKYLDRLEDDFEIYRIAETFTKKENKKIAFKCLKQLKHKISMLDTEEEILEYAKTIDKSWDLEYISAFLRDEYKLKLLELNKIETDDIYSNKIVDSIKNFEILKRALRYTIFGVDDIIKKFNEEEQIELIPYTNVNILFELLRFFRNVTFLLFN